MYAARAHSCCWRRGGGEMAGEWAFCLWCCVDGGVGGGRSPTTAGVRLMRANPSVPRDQELKEGRTRRDRGTWVAERGKAKASLEPSAVCFVEVGLEKGRRTTAGLVAVPVAEPSDSGGGGAGNGGTGGGGGEGRGLHYCGRTWSMGAFPALIRRTSWDISCRILDII